MMMRRICRVFLLPVSSPAAGMFIIRVHRTEPPSNIYTCSNHCTFGQKQQKSEGFVERPAVRGKVKKSNVTSGLILNVCLAGRWRPPQSRTFCSSSSDRHHRPSILKHLSSKIRATGPISVAEYMKEVLTNPVMVRETLDQVRVKESVSEPDLVYGSEHFCFHCRIISILILILWLGPFGSAAGLLCEEGHVGSGRRFHHLT